MTDLLMDQSKASAYLLGILTACGGVARTGYGIGLMLDPGKEMVYVAAPCRQDKESNYGDRFTVELHPDDKLANEYMDDVLDALVMGGGSISLKNGKHVKVLSRFKKGMASSWAVRVVVR